MRGVNWDDFICFLLPPTEVLDEFHGRLLSVSLCITDMFLGIECSNIINFCGNNISTIIGSDISMPHL